MQTVVKPNMVHLNTPVSVVRICNKRFSYVLRFFVGCVASTAMFSCEPQATLEPAPVAEAHRPLDEAAASRLSHYLDSLSGNKQFSGVALFARNDSIIVLANGKRKFSSGEALEGNDLFQLASLSKPITAYAVMMLVQSGQLALDKRVAEYLPGFPYDDVLVRQLFTHSSGLGDYAYVTDHLWGKPDSFMCNDDLLCMLMQHDIPVYYRPGHQFDYCNTNYALLATLAETLTGMKFEHYIRKRLFDPLGMVNTHVVNSFERTSAGYDVLGHYPNGSPKEPCYLDGIVGDKGVYSNVFDLYKFYMEVKHPTLLSDSLVALSMQPLVRVRKGNFYGLGWRVRELDDDTIIFHNGWWRGFRSYFWFSKDHNKVAIVLTNSVRGGYLSQHKLWALF